MIPTTTPKTKTKKCEGCGQEFLYSRNNARYCKECQRKRHNELAMQRNVDVYKEARPDRDKRVAKYNIDLSKDSIKATKAGKSYGEWRASLPGNQVTVVVPRNLKKVSER